MMASMTRGESWFCPGLGSRKMVAYLLMMASMTRGESWFCPGLGSCEIVGTY